MNFYLFISKINKMTDFIPDSFTHNSKQYFKKVINKNLVHFETADNMNLFMHNIKNDRDIYVIRSTKNNFLIRNTFSCMLDFTNTKNPVKYIEPKKDIGCGCCYLKTSFAIILNDKFYGFCPNDFCFDFVVNNYKLSPKVEETIELIVL